ncbi:unnamed protein product [Urochloa humidicola]
MESPWHMGSSPLLPPPRAAISFALRVHHSACYSISLLSLFMASFSSACELDGDSEELRSSAPSGSTSCTPPATSSPVAHLIRPTMLRLPPSHAWVPVARAAAYSRYWPFSQGDLRPDVRRGRRACG